MDPWGEATPTTDPTARDPTAPRDDGVAMAWHVFLGLDLALIGLLVLGGLILALTGEATSDGEVSKALLWAQIGASAFIFGIIPFLWVRFTRVGGWRGLRDYLNLDPRRAANGFVEGVGWTVVLFALLALIVYGYTALYGEPETSPVIQDIVDTLDWPLAIGLSLSAGIGEEILFRGILQRWFATGFRRTGMGPGIAAGLSITLQGLLFGAAHAGYDTVLNWFVPLVLGFVFGILYYWRRSLWIVITAHVLYDLALLGAALSGIE